MDRGAVVLVIGAGWGVRTFLQTDVLDILAEHAPVVILAHPDLVSVIRDRTPHVTEVAPLVGFDANRGALGRLSQRRNHLFLAKAMTTTRRANLRRGRGKRGLRKLARRWLIWLEASLTRGRRVRALAALEAAAFAAAYPQAVADYRRLLRHHRARLVVSTTAYLPIEAPPVRIAQELGIATACWINSWDNPSSKGPLPIVYDGYFLWSDHLMRDLHRFYPECRDKPCCAVGVPHFDPFADAGLRGSRDAHCRRLGLDPDRPTVLYAACTPFLAPHEHLVVERLADDLAAARWRRAPQLVVRLHPSDDGRRFAPFAQREGVILDVPGAARDGRPAGIYAFYPEPRDIQHAVASLCHADVVVNIASTISLEAAIADRPTVNVAFDLAPGAPDQERIREYYRYEHYRTVVETEAVRLAESPEALLDAIHDGIEDPDRERAGRARLAALWCAPPGHSPADGQAGQRLGRALATRFLAGDPPSGDAAGRHPRNHGVRPS